MRATYKSDAIVEKVVPLEMARNLKAKFENWKSLDEDRENNKNMTFEGAFYKPSIDTAKNLKAKFEAIKYDTLKTSEKPKFRVNRFTVSLQRDE